MKFYNDFNAMFNAQSGLKSDLSVSNEHSFAVTDTVEDCNFKLKEDADLSVYNLAYENVNDCCNAAIKLAKCSLDDVVIKQKCDNEGLSGYAKSLLNYVLNNRENIGKGDLKSLGKSINSKFRLKFNTNMGSEYHTLLFEGRTEGTHYDTIDEVKVNDAGNSLIDAVQFFPVIGDSSGFLSSISDCLKALGSGISEFCDFVYKIADE